MERVNNNSASLVSWTPLTLLEARGFPVYFVTYQLSSQVGRVARAVNTVNTTDSKVVIDDLDPTTEYTFTVDVGTAGGKLRSTLGAGKLIQVIVFLLNMTHRNSETQNTEHRKYFYDHAWVSVVKCECMESTVDLVLIYMCLPL